VPLPLPLLLSLPLGICFSTSEVCHLDRSEAQWRDPLVLLPLPLLLSFPPGICFSTNPACNQAAAYAAGFRFTARRSISSARVCQPSPVAFSASTTSRDNRIVTGIFVGETCGPRPRGIIFSISGGSWCRRIPRANISSVMNMSSGSVTDSLGLFVILPHFARVGLAQSNGSKGVFAGRNIGQHMQFLSDKSDRDVSRLSVIHAVVQDVQATPKSKSAARSSDIPCFLRLILSLAPSKLTNTTQIVRTICVS
jgi:hypothetical protein